MIVFNGNLICCFFNVYHGVISKFLTVYKSASCFLNNLGWTASEEIDHQSSEPGLWNQAMDFKFLTSFIALASYIVLCFPPLPLATDSTHSQFPRSVWIQTYKSLRYCLAHSKCSMLTTRSLKFCGSEDQIEAEVIPQWYRQLAAKTTIKQPTDCWC